MDAVGTTWDHIHKTFTGLDSDHLDSLEKPAKREAIAKLEKTVKARLPADFAESLKIHDGQKSGTEIGAFPGFYFDTNGGSYFLLGTRSIIRHWRDLCAVWKAGDLNGRVAKSGRGVQPVMWDHLWIPFAANGGGDYFCLDLHPSRGGIVGQVINWEGDNGKRTVAAKSFVTWLAKRHRTIVTRIRERMFPED
jgi:cell wall assembly regulator SMI1